MSRHEPPASRPPPLTQCAARPLVLSCLEGSALVTSLITDWRIFDALNSVPPVTANGLAKYIQEQLEQLVPKLRLSSDGEESETRNALDRAHSLLKAVHGGLDDSTASSMRDALRPFLCSALDTTGPEVPPANPRAPAAAA